ncbi:uncharacterized protein LOC129220656 [Uloborus diversus]|uniref:uncharacterized protein LOC129220656 n=1 Tax=Uloborus diversus TaxID=327109 RepID=UPI00240A137B|nr:uncharacterized protein LOC129220656 [Uloborus diversus]
MLVTEEYVLSIAFFLHLIVGVNQEISTISLSDNVHKRESLLTEAWMAQRKHQQTVHDRCGGQPSVLPYICNCDPLCSYYNDCCSDFEKLCHLDSNTTETVFPERHATPSCTRDIQGIRMDDIPAAFSILLNFGLDGRERMYISSEGEKDMKYYQELCGSSYIWDPFSKVCRKLYCSTEFVLVDYKCVKKEDFEGQVSSYNKTAKIPDSDAKFVHLSLSAEMELLDILHFHGLEPSEICETIHDSLCQSFNIKKERIRNVSFNVSVANFTDIEQMMIFVNNMEDSELITFTIDFDLYEDISVNDTALEPSVDSIVSMLASALSINGFEFEVNNVTGRIFELHQTVSTLTSWCNPDNGGERKEYWNSDFTLVLGNDSSPLVGNKIKGIYVNKTQKFYSSGQFVADILFQGYQFSGNLINVSGLAVICDWKAKLDESCPRILLERHEYEVLRNGTVVIHNSSLSNRIINNVYEVTDNDSILMCLHTVIPNTTNEFYRLDMNIAQALVSYILSWISIIALSIVFITYTIFPKLRNLPGCNTMNLTFCLICMQITFIFGQRSTVVGLACKMVALILHYEILCSLMWMNVIAYDLYQTFGNKYIKSSIRSKAEYLLKYMAYSYVIPLLIIAVATLLDQFVESDFSPHYGRSDRCWITSKCAAIVFFALPLGLIMFVNYCFFVLTIISIRSVRHNLYLSNQSNARKGKSEVFLYSRMALVIGLTWATAFAAAYVREEKLTGQILTYCFIIFNTLQGVFIFCVFVCNRTVFELYRKTFRQLAKRINCGTNSTSALSKLANVMKRTVSSDTVVSTISNSSGASNETQLSTLRENDVIIDSHNV